MSSAPGEDAAASVESIPLSGGLRAVLLTREQVGPPKPPDPEATRRARIAVRAAASRRLSARLRAEAGE